MIFDYARFLSAFDFARRARVNSKKLSFSFGVSFVAPYASHRTMVYSNSLLRASILLRREPPYDVVLKLFTTGVDFAPT